MAGNKKSKTDKRKPRPSYTPVTLADLSVAGGDAAAWICSLAVRLLCWRRERILTGADFVETTGLTPYRIATGLKSAAERGWVIRKSAGGRVYYYAIGKFHDNEGQDESADNESQDESADNDERSPL